MIKKSLYFLLALSGLLIISYVLQPIKKGKALETAAKYELVENCFDSPGGFSLGNPTGIGIGTNQNIVVFHRANREWPFLGSMPGKPIKNKTILIIDKDNRKLIESWGDNLFIMPHGLTVDDENNIWVTDVGLHQIF